MIIPCKDCITFPMCKSRGNIDEFGGIIGRCKLIQNYIFDEDTKKPEKTYIEYDILKIDSEHYVEFLKLMGVL